MAGGLAFGGALNLPGLSILAGSAGSEGRGSGRSPSTRTARPLFKAQNKILAAPAGAEDCRSEAQAGCSPRRQTARLSMLLLRLGLPFGGVILRMYFLQVVDRHMGVNLRRFQGLMP